MKKLIQFRNLQAMAAGDNFVLGFSNTLNLM